jgi:hypothetical protein
VSAIRVCDRESEPAGLNPQLTVPAHPRHDLPAVVFCCSGHDRLVVTVSEQEPSLTHLSGGFFMPAGSRWPVFLAVVLRCTTLNWPQSFPLMVNRLGMRSWVSKKIKKWRVAMMNALQINVALWGMIGCAACKSVQLIQYFNW